jgi:hypothetical protein
LQNDIEIRPEVNAHVVTLTLKNLRHLT